MRKDAKQPQNAPITLARRTSGIPGLDVILNGGLLTDRSYLLVGPAGSGKTLFSLQWLLEGIKQKESCVYITLAERHEEIERDTVNFQWDLSKIKIIDLSPSKKAVEHQAQEYHIFSPEEVETITTWEEIYQIVKQYKPQRLVIDSATQLRYLATDEYQYRKHILSLVTFLNVEKVTTLLLFEPTELARETSIGLAVDGILRINLQLSTLSLITIRTFQVEKFRGSNFLSGIHMLRIGDKGIHLYPHIIEPVGSPTPGSHLIPSGVKKLDELLFGGIDSGTTTLISGPSGVGKSVLSMQFLITFCQSGKKGLLFAFEESIDSICIRSRNLGMPIDEMLEKKLLKIIRINPLAIYPDQFLDIVRHEIHTHHFEMVVIDSLRSYMLSMQAHEGLISHVHNLVTYLHRKKINTILINETQNITGDLSVTELGVSHLADNVILIRYAEYASQVIKVIACLKKRLSNFQPELRQISLSNKGIKISEKLEFLQGILSGNPTIIK